MNKKIEASGLLLVAISGLTASSTVGATSSDSKASDVPVSNELKLIDYLTYEDQKDIYKNLTSNRFGFSGKDLPAVTKSDIRENFSALYKKDPKKFNSYIDDNYGSKLLVYNFKNNPCTSSHFDTLLNKINSDLSIKRENASKDGKGGYLPPIKLGTDDLIRSDMLTVDYAYEERSPLVSLVDKTTIYSMLREKAEEIGLRREIIDGSHGSLELIDNNITDPSTKRRFRTIVANTLAGKKDVLPRSSKPLSGYAGGFILGGIFVSLAYVFRKQISRVKDFVFGRKNKENDTKNENKKNKPENLLEPYPD